MKYIFFTGLIIFLTGCSSKQQKPLDIRSVKATSGEMILLGKINKANLQVSPLTPWFNQDYQIIPIEAKWIESVKPYLKGLRVKIFMGTWCEDSQREIPHFFKLLESLEFDPNHIEMYAMSEEKSTPENFEKGWEIFNIPTIIFLKNGIEINRFVEFPKISLESDIIKIIKREDYSHSYK